MPPTPKRQRRLLLRRRRRVRKAIKHPYTLGEDICHIFPVRVEGNRNYGNRIKQLKYLLFIRKYGDKDQKKNFMIIRTGLGARQTWGMVEEAIKSFQILPPNAIIKNDEMS